MFYVERKEYDSTFQVGDKEIRCFSRNEMSKIYSNGEYRIVGETFKNNNDKDGQKLKLAGEIFVISEYRKHKRFFKKIAGFICVGEDQYVALLRTRLIPFVLITLFGLVLVSLILFLNNKNEQDSSETTKQAVLRPTYERETAETEESASGETKTVDITIQIPTGEVISNINLEENINGELNTNIYITIDGTEYLIYKGDIEAVNGIIQNFDLNMLDVHVELLKGHYSGRIEITDKNGDNICSKDISIRVARKNQGSLTVEYDKNVSVLLSDGKVTMEYNHKKNSTQNVVIQVIVISDENEFLISESEVIRPGTILTEMPLNEGIKELLEPNCIYKGVIRVCLYSGDSNAKVAFNTDIEAEIHTYQ